MSKMALIVVGIDFGTTFSGWAYSTHDDFATDPTKIFAPQWNSSDQMISLKTPTCILIKPDGKTVDTFGYDAENRYTQLAADEIHKDWYFFRRFKMKLYDAQESIAQSTMLKDETGKELKALTVFSLSIKCLRDDFYDHLSRSICGKFNTSDIHWVLTVPAIWDEPAKQFMRTSAQEAGLEIEHLSLALEPEAASIYCRHAKMIRTENLKTQNISTFKSGTRYLVCDTGGTRHVRNMRYS
ncbi:heat shock 70 kDa protein 12A-like [Dreissena polymorpha]|uniref:heat shock 70 kDa protein 12A-like n=1 Tax=Dreissena polymorpha TaxID=45954 RepID=UPI0022652D7E|nr:heat shock 70 kDa protein 12A-like [Dreissena polymorpha]